MKQDNSLLQEIVLEEYKEFSDKYHIKTFPQPYDVFAVISTESAWNPTADSGYARGLMQVSQPALRTINWLYNTKFSYDDMLDPAKNVFVGIRYLRYLYRVFKQTNSAGITNLVIMSYNWGQGNVLQWLSMKRPDNSVIDENVPQETKLHLFDFIFWREYWHRELKL